MNKVTLRASLARDPELKMIGDLKRTIMCVQIKNSFINIVVEDRLGEHCAEYLEKGNRILVDGKLHGISEVHAKKITFLGK